uniref:Exonuclease XPMC2 n=1 Tax=Leptobrachium leishanense TaxID=445787 RepID=A0A8C5WL87_9ANUR
MADMVLNLDLGPNPSGGRKETSNKKHQQFVQKRKFLERRGFLKQKQLPVKSSPGQASHTQDQGRRRRHQDGGWATRTVNPVNEIGVRKGLTHQVGPQCQSSRPPGILTVTVGSSPHQSRSAHYIPNRAQASSKGGPPKGDAQFGNSHPLPAPLQHSINLLSEFESGLPATSAASKPSYKMVAIDCEMVGTGPKGCNSGLARCSIVNYHGDIVYDKYIHPENPITDYRTRWSGIRREHMVNATPFALAQKEILKILNGKIVIGHAIHNDFKALKYFHPKDMTRDTSLIPLLNVKAGIQDKGAVSLKRFAKILLNKNIQTGKWGHSSVEDAKTTMELYRVIEAEWERELATRPPKTNA